MMFNQKFVACIKSSGKVLREFGDTVYLPFGSEYSILLKNLNSVRAQVSITIDGKDVLNGSSLIVNANDSIDLERFLETNDKGHKFKFIERTQQIEQHRGVGVDDGIVRIEYKFEKTYDFSKPLFRSYWDNSMQHYNHGYIVTYNTYGALNTANTIRSAASQSFVNDTGITGKGEISDQKFQTVSAFITENETHVIVLQLKGDVGQTPITKPVDVKQKQECDICGKKNRATSKFCSECGNSLTIV